MKIAFIDTETTGLTEQDEIIDIHIAVWNDGEIITDYEAKFMPLGACHPGAQKVNGFDIIKWQGAPTFRESHAREIQAVLNQADMLGGCCVAFDKGMLERQFKRVRLDMKLTTHRTVDIQSLAVPLVYAGKIQTPSLHNLMTFFGLGDCKHTARADNEATIAIFEKLVGAYYEGAEAL